MGSATLILESVRNSLTWHLTRFWGGAGSVWQNLWEWLLSYTGDDDYNLGVYGTFILTSTIFWTIGSMFSYLDVTNKPSFLRRFKIQPGTNEPVDPKKFRSMIWTVLFNQTAIYLPLLMVGDR